MYVMRHMRLYWKKNTFSITRNTGSLQTKFSKLCFLGVKDLCLISHNSISFIYLSFKIIGFNTNIPFCLLITIWFKIILWLASLILHTQVIGLNTNIQFLIDLVKHREFQAGNVHTDFIPQHEADLFPTRKITDITLCQAAVAMVLFQQKDQKSKRITNPLGTT